MDDSGDKSSILEERTLPINIPTDFDFSAASNDTLRQSVSDEHHSGMMAGEEAGSVVELDQPELDDSADDDRQPVRLRQPHDHAHETTPPQQEAIGRSYHMSMPDLSRTSASHVGARGGSVGATVSTTNLVIHPGGLLTPLRPMTMREYDEQLSELKKENFNLKLRIYLQDLRMPKLRGSNGEDLLKLNIELEVTVRELEEKLKTKEELLKKYADKYKEESDEHEVAIDRYELKVKELSDEIHHLGGLLRSANDKTQALEAQTKQLTNRQPSATEESDSDQNLSLLSDTHRNMMALQEQLVQQQLDLEHLQTTHQNDRAEIDRLSQLLQRTPTHEQQRLPATATTSASNVTTGGEIESGDISLTAEDDHQPNALNELLLAKDRQMAKLIYELNAAQDQCIMATGELREHKVRLDALEQDAQTARDQEIKYQKTIKGLIRKVEQAKTGALGTTAPQQAVSGLSSVHLSHPEDSGSVAFTPAAQTAEDEKRRMVQSFVEKFHLSLSAGEIRNHEETLKEISELQADYATKTADVHRLLKDKLVKLVSKTDWAQSFAEAIEKLDASAGAELAAAILSEPKLRQTAGIFANQSAPIYPALFSSSLSPIVRPQTAAAFAPTKRDSDSADGADDGVNSGMEGKVPEGTSFAANDDYSMLLSDMTAATELINRTINTTQDLNNFKDRLYTLRKVCDRLYGKLKGSGEFLKDILARLGGQYEGEFNSFRIQLDESLQVAKDVRDNCEDVERSIGNLVSDLETVTRRFSVPGMAFPERATSSAASKSFAAGSDNQNSQQQSPMAMVGGRREMTLVKNELLRLQSENGQLQSRVAQLQQENAQLAANCDSLKEQCRQETDHSANMRTKVETLQNDVQAKRKDLSSLFEQVTAMLDQNQKRVSTSAGTMTLETSFDIERVIVAVEQLSQQVGVLRTNNDALGSENASLQKANGGLLISVDTTKKTVADLHAALKEHAQRLEEADVQIGQLTTALESKERETKAIYERLLKLKDETSKRITTLENELESVDHRFKKSEKEHEAFIVQLNTEYQSRENDSATKLAGVVRELETATQQTLEATEMVQQYQTEQHRLQALCEQLQKQIADAVAKEERERANSDKLQEQLTKESRKIEELSCAYDMERNRSVRLQNDIEEITARLNLANQKPETKNRKLSTEMSVGDVDAMEQRIEKLERHRTAVKEKLNRFLEVSSNSASKGQPKTPTDNKENDAPNANETSYLDQIDELKTQLEKERLRRLQLDGIAEQLEENNRKLIQKLEKTASGMRYVNGDRGTGDARPTLTREAASKVGELQSADRATTVAAAAITTEEDSKQLVEYLKLDNERLRNQLEKLQTLLSEKLQQPQATSSSAAADAAVGDDTSEGTRQAIVRELTKIRVVLQRSRSDLVHMQKGRPPADAQKQQQKR